MLAIAYATSFLLPVIINWAYLMLKQSLFNGQPENQPFAPQQKMEVQFFLGLWHPIKYQIIYTWYRIKW